MAKIQTFPKYRLSLNELLVLGRAIEARIEAENVSILLFRPQFTNFKNCLQNFDDSITRGRKSIYTDMMTESAKIRTKLRAAICGHVRVYMKHHESETVKAAASLMILVNRQKGVSKLRHDEQTGRAMNLIQDLESEKYKDAVTKLNLNSLLTSFKKANNDYINLTNLRLEETRLRDIPQKSAVTKRALCDAYEILVTRLNSLAEVNGDADYIDLFSWWNRLIDTTRTNLSLRLGKGKGGKTDGGDSSRHDPNTGTPGGDDDDHPVID